MTLSLLIMTHMVFLCIAPHKHNTMSAFVIVETPNNRYSTQNSRLNIAFKFFKTYLVSESEVPDCPCDVLIAPLY